MIEDRPSAILVLPHLVVQNANAVASPMTHGFPSVTAFMGFMWALERKLNECGIPLHFHGVGFVCHHSQEHASGKYEKTFHLTRNPLKSNEKSASIVPNGRMHLEVTIVFSASERLAPGQTRRLTQGNTSELEGWAREVAAVVQTMRLAGGSVMPSQTRSDKSNSPWLGVLPDDGGERERRFRTWRRRWLPGFVLVGRDDLLQQRMNELRDQGGSPTLLDAWLHASRFNYRPLCDEAEGRKLGDGMVKWGDPYREKGSGWIVPIPVGYAALTEEQAAGSVKNARDSTVPFRFVESIHSLGEWIGPHHLERLEDMLWFSEVDEEKGTYRCRSGYVMSGIMADMVDGPSMYDEFYECD